MACLYGETYFSTLSHHTRGSTVLHHDHTHQVIKYVPLVDVDGDEGLVLGPLHSPQVSCGHVNQCVEQIQEQLVGFGHNAPIVSGIGQSLLSIPCPYHLNT